MKTHFRNLFKKLHHLASKVKYQIIARVEGLIIYILNFNYEEANFNLH